MWDCCSPLDYALHCETVCVIPAFWVERTFAMFTQLGSVASALSKPNLAPEMQELYLVLVVLWQCFSYGTRSFLEKVVMLFCEVLGKTWP